MTNYKMTIIHENPVFGVGTVYKGKVINEQEVYEGTPIDLYASLIDYFRANQDEVIEITLSLDFFTEMLKESNSRGLMLGVVVSELGKNFRLVGVKREIKK